MERKNLERLARLPDRDPRQEASREWRRAHRTWREAPLLGTEDERAWEAREVRLAKTIARLHRVESSTLVHIGGWRHLAGLSKHLRDILHPKRGEHGEHAERDSTPIQPLLLDASRASSE
jgi:hypothetical protein